MSEFWTYGFFTRNFGGFTFGFSMFAAWAALSLALSASICAWRGWRRNRALIAIGALISVGAYLALGFLIAPAYSGSDTEFLWNSDRWLDNLLGGGGWTLVLFWPCVVLVCAQGC